MIKYKRFLLFPLILSFNLLLSENLILQNGQTIAMNGTHTYETISLSNGSFINATGGNFTLTLYVDSLYISVNSGIRANAISTIAGGYPASDIVIAGGGGGGGYGSYGGSGGGSIASMGGAPYGNNANPNPGSRGGDGDNVNESSSNWRAPGGGGGGLISIYARISIIHGSIQSNGGNGGNGVDYYSDNGYDNGGGGGGSGGHIFLDSKYLYIEDISRIQARGGNGGQPLEGHYNDSYIPGGGGGGSGGRILITSADEPFEDNGTCVAGGSGGTLSVESFSGTYGMLGSFTFIKKWLSSTSHPDASLWYLDNNPAFNLSANGNIQGYFYDFTQASEHTVDLESNFVDASLNSARLEFSGVVDGEWYLHATPFSGSGQYLDSLKLSMRINIAYSALSISSASHPNSEWWYTNSSILLNLISFPGIVRYHYELNQFPLTVPLIGSSEETSNTAWIIPSLDNGVYFFHMLAEDILGNLSENVIRKRFNIGEVPSMGQFSQTAPQNYGSHNISSSEIANDLVFDWGDSFHVEDGNVVYNVSFYNGLSGVFNDTSLAQSELSFNNLYDIYPKLLSLNTDSVNGHWWVLAESDNQSISSLNGPFELTIKIDESVNNYSPFELALPDTNFVIINEGNFVDPLKLTWTSCTSVFNDSMEYIIELDGILGLVFGDSSTMDTTLSLSYIDMYSFMIDAGINQASGQWNVFSTNGIDTVQSLNGPSSLIFELDTLVSNFVPFNLVGPIDSSVSYITQNNILDSLIFNWENSFHVFDEQFSFEILFRDTNNTLNENISTIFPDIVTSESFYKFSILDIFNSMDSTQSDSLFFNWSVVISSGDEKENSVNGPFYFKIFKNDIDINRPLASLNFPNSSFVSRNLDYEIQVSYIEEDSLNINIDYSLDLGETWVNLLSLDTTNSAVIESSWNVFEKFGWTYIDPLYLRVFAQTDSLVSDTIISDNIIIANIVGDYINDSFYEIGIKANDISLLIENFYNEGLSITDYDIGPSTGIAPDLSILPDGVINFEDLATFTQMWYWSSENINNDLNNFDLVSDKNSDWTLSINKIDNDNYNTLSKLNLKNEFSGNVAGFDLEIKYDPKKVSFISIDKGDIWKALDNNSIILNDYDQENGSFKISFWNKYKNTHIDGNWISFNTLNTNNDIELELIYTSWSDKNTKIKTSKSTSRVELKNIVIDDFTLSNNYPNPFNPITVISYNIPKSVFVKVSVYDLNGRKIKNLVNSPQSPGKKYVTWDGTNDLGSSISAGMYLYTIQAGEFRQTRKMVLLK